ELGFAAPVVGARSEEERARRAGETAVAEGDAPEAVDGDWPPVRAAKHAVVGPTVGGATERIDPTVAEVADEQIAAEPAEAFRRERHPPRRVQRPHPAHA